MKKFNVNLFIKQIKKFKNEKNFDAIELLLHENPEFYFIKNFDAFCSQNEMKQFIAKDIRLKPYSYWVDKVKENYKENISSHVTTYVLSHLIKKDNLDDVSEKDLNVVQYGLQNNHFKNYLDINKFIIFCRYFHDKLLPAVSDMNTLYLFIENKNKDFKDALYPQKKIIVQNFLDQKIIDIYGKENLLFFNFFNNLTFKDKETFEIEQYWTDERKNAWKNMGFSQDYLNSNMVYSADNCDTSFKLNQKLKKLKIDTASLDIIPANKDHTLMSYLFFRGKLTTCKRLNSDYELKNFNTLLLIQHKSMTNHDYKELFKKLKKIDLNNISQKTMGDCLFLNEKLFLNLSDIKQPMISEHYQFNALHFFNLHHQEKLDDLLMRYPQYAKKCFLNIMNTFQRSYSNLDMYENFLKDFVVFFKKLNYQAEEFHYFFDQFIVNMQEKDNLSKHYNSIDVYFKQFLVHFSPLMMDYASSEQIQKIDNILINNQNKKYFEKEQLRECMILLDNIKIIKNLNLEEKNKKSLDIKYKKI